MNFSDHYENWQKSRMEGLLKYISPSYFQNKNMLELGCGYADIGNIFYNLGANIKCSDAREEHLEVVNKKHPHIKTFRFDCDNEKLNEKYDIILHWGLLYHLKNIEEHLNNILDKCNVLLLESEVSDSNDINYNINIYEQGYDQAYNNSGSRPSPKYIENILTKNGFNFKMIKDPILNSNFHIYDWDISETKIHKNGLRRFWICWKDVISPIIYMYS
jgi:hypothetical protein